MLKHTCSQEQKPSTLANNVIGIPGTKKRQPSRTRTLLAQTKHGTTRSHKVLPGDKALALLRVSRVWTRRWQSCGWRERGHGSVTGAALAPITVTVTLTRRSYCLALLCARHRHLQVHGCHCLWVYVCVRRRLSVRARVCMSGSADAVLCMCSHPEDSYLRGQCQRQLSFSRSESQYPAT